MQSPLSRSAAATVLLGGLLGGVFVAGVPVIPAGLVVYTLLTVLGALATVVLGWRTRALAMPTFVLGYVLVAYVRESAYEVPRGFSGIDAMGPKEEIYFVLPVYAVLLGGAAVLRLGWSAARRRRSGGGPAWSPSRRALTVPRSHKP